MILSIFFKRNGIVNINFCRLFSVVNVYCKIKILEINFSYYDFLGRWFIKSFGLAECVGKV